MDTLLVSGAWGRHLPALDRQASLAVLYVEYKAITNYLED